MTHDEVFVLVTSRPTRARIRSSWSSTKSESDWRSSITHHEDPTDAALFMTNNPGPQRLEASKS